MKILIANRGEIALRVIRACRKLGHSPVAVYSEADREAAHVRAADEAYLLGPAPAAQSYLNIEKILAIAMSLRGAKRRSNPHKEIASLTSFARNDSILIHPGYGFLSENADFARACEKAGHIFIGPTSAAMRRLGDKVEARRLAAKLGIPMVPGVVEEIHNAAEAQKVARRIGLPIMIKAVGGGGGKGIRVVRKLEEIPGAFAMACSEAQTAFKNPKVFIEKFVEGARHIEIQVIADKKGNCVSLGERECSVQRRFQKLIEESPSPFITPASEVGARHAVPLRHEMEKAAKRLIEAAGYTNAGTAEFLVDRNRNFYFLEVNTRLQVEHPVTEMVRGVDLVCEQIRVALGEKLSFSEKNLRWSGHAIEARIYAEDPENRFFPSAGKIGYLETPRGENIRLESSLFPGLEVGLHYDPLLAKLIAWGKTREEAMARLDLALSEFIVDGVKTTIPFFREVLRTERFRRGDLDIQFVDQWLAEEKKPAAKDLEFKAALAAFLYHLQREKEETVVFAQAGRKISAWQNAVLSLRGGQRPPKQSPWDCHAPFGGSQ